MQDFDYNANLRRAFLNIAIVATYAHNDSEGVITMTEPFVMMDTPANTMRAVKRHCNVANPDGSDNARRWWGLPSSTAAAKPLNGATSTTARSARTSAPNNVAFDAAALAYAKVAASNVNAAGAKMHAAAAACDAAGATDTARDLREAANNAANAARDAAVTAFANAAFAALSEVFGAVTARDAFDAAFDPRDDNA
jgi:hypothetical protein